MVYQSVLLALAGQINSRRYKAGVRNVNVTACDYCVHICSRARMQQASRQDLQSSQILPGSLSSSSVWTAVGVIATGDIVERLLLAAGDSAHPKRAVSEYHGRKVEFAKCPHTRNPICLARHDALVTFVQLQKAATKQGC